MDFVASVLDSGISGSDSGEGSGVDLGCSAGFRLEDHSCLALITSLNTSSAKPKAKRATARAE